MTLEQKELVDKFNEFIGYMTNEKWEALDVYESEGLNSVSAFIGYCVNGEWEPDAGGTNTTEFGGNGLGAIPVEWTRHPTEGELQTYLDVKLRLVAIALASRLNTRINDGECFKMDKAGFDELASEMDDQIDENGLCYIGDWLSETMEKNDHYKEEG